MSNIAHTHGFNHAEEVPLIATVVNNEKDCSEQRVQREVNVNENPTWSATLLCRAACIGKVDLMKRLLDLGADVEATTHKGETALHIAVQCGQADAISLLLESGANIQASDSKGRTALHFAVEGGEDTYVVVSLLLANGADVWAKTLDGLTALDCTHQSKQANIISLLRQRYKQTNDLKLVLDP